MANKLDVDFEVIEHPEDVLFPHQPNTVSRRGHRVKLSAIIREVPDNTTRIKFKATILTHGKQTIGENEHLACPVQVWGSAPEKIVGFPSEEYPTLPCKIELIVPRTLGDDHLGEGPYQGFANIKTDNLPFNPDEVNKPDSGNGDGAESSSIIDPVGLFSIQFVSK